MFAFRIVNQSWFKKNCFYGLASCSNIVKSFSWRKNEGKPVVWHFAIVFLISCHAILSPDY